MHLKSNGKMAILLALVVISRASRALADEVPPQWNKEQAANYLDERAKAWLAFPSAGRGEDETKTSCISCHTAGPYLLARPVLRKLAGAGQPTEYEKKFVEQTRLRVEHWEELDSPSYRLLYDFDDQKKKESWGTEAVLNAVVLAFDDRYYGHQTPSDSTLRAFANLWQAQTADGDHSGAWEWLNFLFEPWESTGARYFGAALAAVAVGTAPGYYSPGADAGVDRSLLLLRTYLNDHRAEQNLFNRVWLLWASCGLDGLLTADERTAAISELLEAQQADGGWRLASLGAFTRRDETPQALGSDGYATGLVLHVLQMAGVSKETEKIAGGLAWLRTNQSSTGEWRATSVNKERDPASHTGRFMSDSATAYAILALSH
jgi:squalene-hopene/tetraprenyl-beta-curcumene cyclase